jgi:hypothetical protein
MFSQPSSKYTLTGDNTKTLFALTNVSPSGSSNLSTLSTNNYPSTGDSNPNADNQLVFKNQPLSWWLASLNSGDVKYTPVSNNVNWAYYDSNKNAYHISIEVSNLLIPNKTASVKRNQETNVTEVTFEAKFGLSRVDTMSM